VPIISKSLSITVASHSESVECHISEGILEAVVPEEEDVVFLDLLDPIQHNLDYIGKRTTRVRIL